MKNRKTVLLGICLVLLLTVPLVVGACAQQAAPAPSPSPAPAPKPTATAPAPAPTAAPAPATTTAASPAKVYQMNLSSHAAAVSPQNTFLQQWSDLIAKNSNGRIKIRIYPQATLLASVDNWDGVAKGVADIGYCYRYETRGTDFIQYVGYFMAGSTSGLTGEKIQYDLYDKFPEFRNEWSANKVLVMASSSPGTVHTRNKDISTFDAIKGLQIRASGAADADIVKALGGTAVTMTMDEVYEALQKGMVAGYIGANETLQSWRLAEVSKYTVTYGVRQATGAGFYMNWDSYNSLPADLKKVIDDSIPAAKDQLQKTLDDIDAPSVQYAKEQKGHTFIVLSPEQKVLWQAALKPLQQKWVDSVNAKGLPGTALYDFIVAKVKEYETK